MRPRSVRATPEQTKLGGRLLGWDVVEPDAPA
jgi:hypothetical protein